MSGFDLARLDVASIRKKHNEGTPLVTIFGAGISGLTAAHELIEKGFAVQVVEPATDPDHEYRCQVGGLAATQVAHAPATVRQAHAYLFNEDPDGEDHDDPITRSALLKVVKTGTETLVFWLDQKEIARFAADTLSKSDILAKLEAAVPTADYTTATTNFRLRIANKNDRLSPFVSVTKEDGTETGLVEFESVDSLRRLRDLDLHPTSLRISTRHRIQMEVTATNPGWEALADNRGVKNADKLPILLARLTEAFSVFEADRHVRAASAGNVATFSRNEIREGLVIQIRAHSHDPDKTDHENQLQSKKWATWVETWLETNGTAIDQIERRLIKVPVGNREPIANEALESGRRENDRVEIRIVESLLPGEHGYRFFPRFYRHLFDTMKRTPILDENGVETGSTAFDQLIATPTVDVALSGGAEPEHVPVRRPRSLDELRKLLKLHLTKRKEDLDTAFQTAHPSGKRPTKDGGLGVTETDLLRFQLAILKYLTSSKARREQKYEEQSWFDFLMGDWDQASGKPCPYSDEMIRIIMETPQALVAMDAEETDARSQGTVYCQLLLDGLTDGEEANRTLNGPTSAAWLGHWKAYLKRQGVRFFTGEVKKLKWAKRPDGGDELVPEVDMNPEVAMQGTLSVLNVEGEELTALVNGMTATIRTPPDISFAATALSEQINKLNVGADARWQMNEKLEATGRIEVVSHGVALRLNLPPGNPSVGMQINGTAVADPSSGGDVRRKLIRNIEAAAPELLVRAWRTDEILVDVMPGSQMVSIRTGTTGHGITIYDVPRQDGELVSVSAQHTPPPGGSLLDIRDALADSLATKLASLGDPMEVKPFGDTGLEVRNLNYPLRPRVEITGGILGPDITVTPAASPPVTITVPAPPVLLPRSPGLAMVGAIPESSDGDFVIQEINGEGELLPSPGGGPDFYLLAVPFEEASRLIWGAWRDRDPWTPDLLDGCFGQLQKFDIATGRNHKQLPHEDLPMKRDDHGRPEKTYPLRDLSGIQYFFHRQVRVGRGHTYYPDAKWGLSSISQLTYWRRRMSNRASAFIGQLSVVIGNWYRAYGDDGQRVPSAWRSTRREIAEHTWSQIKEGMDDLERPVTPNPTYYHLDQAIEFGDEPKYRTTNAQLASGSGAVFEPVEKGALATSLHVSLGGNLEELSADQKTTKGEIVTALAGEVMGDPAKYPLLAAVVDDDAMPPQPNRLLLTPFAQAEVNSKTGLSKAVVRVLEVVAGDYVVRINGQDAHIAAVAGDTETAIRDKLADEINANITGVVAVKPTHENRKKVLILRAASALTVAALGPQSPGGSHSLVVNPPRLIEFKLGNNIALIEGETPMHNAAPFLINGPVVWKSRPGLNDITSPSSGGPIHTKSTQGEKRMIDYEPTLKRWLMAGNQMATHTRMSTMESANESARHAVIAILHALITAEGPDPIYNGQGTLVGDMPRLFDPEEHEIDDTLPLKRLDQKLMSLDPPCEHVLDILRVDQMIDQLPDLEALPAEGEPLMALIQHAGQQVTSDWDFTQADEMQRAVQGALAALVGIESRKKSPPS